MSIKRTLFGLFAFVALILSQNSIFSLAAAPLKQEAALEALAIDLEHQHTTLGLHSSYLVLENTEKIGIKELLTPQYQSRFQRHQRKYPNFGFDNRVYWYQIPVKNRSDQTLQRVFTTGWPGLASDAYLYFPKTKTVTKLPPYHPENWHPLYLAHFPPKAEAVLYFSTYYPDEETHVLKLRLMTPQAYWKSEIKYHLLTAMFYGAALIMVAYNLFLFFSTRTKVYLFYSLTLLANCWYLLGVDGLGMQYIWGVSNSMEITHFGSAIYGFSLIVFSRSLLSTKTNLPLWDKILVVALYFYGLIIASVFIIPIDLVGFINVIGGILTPLLFFVTGVKSIKKTGRIAVFFVVGWFFALLGIINISLVLSGLPIFDMSWMETNLWYKLGAFIEVTFFALALADRFNRLQREKLESKHALLEVSSQHALQLEQKVNERTNELTEANNMKNKFFSIISHDLRGPMGSLASLFKDVIQKPKDLDEDLLSTVRHSTKQLYSLLDQLLNWSKSQSGNMELEKRSFSIEKTVIEMLDVIKPQAHQKEIQITLEPMSDLFVYADVETVTTVIRNLLGNAVKYTPQQGEIRVRGIEQEGMVRIEVSDNGVGIDPKQKAKLFKIDEKVHSTNGTANETGSGLGLILVKEFTGSNGGEVGVSSELGVGSKFWFSLPRTDRPNNENFHVVTQLPEAVQSVLIVDDDQLHQAGAKQVLMQFGVQCDFAFNGESAIEMARKSNYQVILMDIGMPGLNGVETTTILKQLKGTFKIIALSAYSKKEVIEKFKIGSFDGYLNKPLEADKLLQMMTRLYSS